MDGLPEVIRCEVLNINDKTNEIVKKVVSLRINIFDNNTHKEYLLLNNFYNFYVFIVKFRRTLKHLNLKIAAKSVIFSNPCS